MCPPVTLTSDDLLRVAARERAAAMMKPGDKVRVCRREVESPPDSRGNIGSHFLDKLLLWRRPDIATVKLGNRWREFRDDPDLALEYKSNRGPTLLLGTAATVLAVLPFVASPPNHQPRSRPWVLLLSDAGELGWCYALDGLSLLTYYDDDLLPSTSLHF